jgi:3-methyladenine DNA glycosylase/8-oxoguanine DNA glycosylase
MPTIRLKTPGGFSLHRTIYSHGWCALPPFRVGEDKESLQAVIPISSGGSRRIFIRDDPGGGIAVRTVGPITGILKKEMAQTVSSILRLNEDFSEFHSAAAQYPEYKWIPAAGAGRLLRAPTVFEDLVKMMCTTNCSWALTEVMVANLCSEFGEQVDEGDWTFPSPAAIASSNERTIRNRIRAGYRSPYLLECSRAVVEGKLNPEEWRTTRLPTDEVFHAVRSVKGIGPYAAGNILKLLGRYDYLGIDSWCRKKFSEMFHRGRKVTDRTIERHYAPFGKYRGLFFWLDVTKQWYDEKFPF